MNKNSPSIFILPSSFLLYSCLFIEAWRIKCLKGHHQNTPLKSSWFLCWSRITFVLVLTWIQTLKPWSKKRFVYGLFLQFQALAEVCGQFDALYGTPKEKTKLQSLIKMKQRNSITDYSTYILLSWKYFKEKFLVSAHCRGKNTMQPKVWNILTTVLTKYKK